jgi:hypothetical protein
LPVFNGNQNTANDGDAVAGTGPATSAGGAPASTIPSPTTDASPAPSPIPSQVAQPSTKASRKTTTGPTSPGAAEQPVKKVAVPVYWLGGKIGAQDKSSVRLYRTWAEVSGRPAVEAVRVMTSKQPADPDYYSVWRGAAVNTVTRAGGVVTVDFKQLPKKTLDAATADLATQQLIYTVQGALEDSTEPVRITQSGRSGLKLFGQIDTSSPLGRAQAADVQALVSIDSPAEGQVTGPKVLVKGTAIAFEATVNYRVTNRKTQETKKGFTTAAEGQKLSPFMFSVTLTPGQWQIEAFLISDADGRITDVDSKTIYVK